MGRVARSYGTTRVAWAPSSADKGYAKAQSELGIAYETGRGVERDEALAVIWFARSLGDGDDAPKNAAMFLGARTPAAKQQAALQLLIKLGYAAGVPAAMAVEVFRRSEGLSDADGVDDALLVALARKQWAASHPS